MKKLYLALICLCLMTSAWAESSPTTLTVSSTAGGLSSAIKTAGGSLTTITSLTITGTIDQRDFNAIRDSMQALTNIDMSEANIAAYSIGSQINVIPSFAFSSCQNLTSINIPNSVTKIEQYSFNNCPKLKSIIIPNSVTTIGSSAFNECNNLESINIPSSVTSIEKSAFYNCSSLTSIDILGLVKSINSATFYGCSKLVSITLPSSLTLIDKYAFYNCTSLTSIVIPTSVTSIKSNTFYNCTNLTSITIPTSVTSIEDNAFGLCKSLKDISIPSSVTSIGMQAFMGCSSSTFISIPSTLTYIPNDVFMNCSGIITVDPANPNYSSIDGVLYNKNKTRLIITPASKTDIFIVPNFVNIIDDYGFSSCTSLTSITIPNTVTTIGSYAFSNCTGLKSIYVYHNTPLVIPQNRTFNNVPYSTCTLYVPKGTKALYRAAANWSIFWNIVEMNTSSELNAQTSSVKINANNDKAEISGLTQGASVMVYNMQGLVIYNQKATEETISVTLPARGMYIVKVEDYSQKIVY